MLLCCIGCAIFGVTEVSTDGIDFETGDFAYQNAEEGKAPGTGTSEATPAASQPVYVPPPPSAPQPDTTTQEPVSALAEPSVPETTAAAEVSGVEPPSQQEAPIDQLGTQTNDGKDNSGVINELD